MLSRKRIRRLVEIHGLDIIRHRHMQIERSCYQHGVVTTFAHSIRVACLSVYCADRLHLWGVVDLRSLIRAALLHDYFLYDWHDWDGGSHRLHGFTHPRTSLRNAMRDFDLNEIERNSILRHMFPLTPIPPRYVEGYLVTLADKLSATAETLSPDRFLSPRDRPASGRSHTVEPAKRHMPPLDGSAPSGRMETMPVRPVHRGRRAGTEYADSRRFPRLLRDPRDGR